ncbi:hypothetical protein MMC28_007381 [Mycoblastus sanguinarius]|nr:hypothetical protein [Mycoblastus sanguinarius]
MHYPTLKQALIAIPFLITVATSANLPAKARNFPSASGTVSAPYADESYSAQYSSNPETTTSSLSRIYDAITDAMATISDLLPQLSPSEREDNYDLPSQNEDN